MNVLPSLPDPLARIVFTKHADRRLRERSGFELDQARDEIRDAIASRSLEHRAKNIWCVHVRHSTRRYPIAETRGVLIVLTVIDDDERLAA